MRILTILTLLIILSGCSKTIDFLSKPLILDMNPPPGPPEYQAGYVDGCSLALQENQHNLFGMTFRVAYKHPVYNNKSNIYRRMWRSAYIHCYLWIPKIANNNGSFFTPDFKLQAKGGPRSKKRNLLMDSPPGPENFRIGWRDGCHTGKASTGEVKHKIAFGFKKDARFIEGDKFNKEYEKGWETAYWYCERFYDIYNSPGRRALM